MNYQNQFRITFVITGLLTGGAELMLYKLLSEIQRDRFDCRVISLTSNGPVGAKIARLEIPVKALGMRPGLPSPHAIFRLAKWLKNDPPDLIQTWMYHADLIGALSARLAGNIPVIWGIRNNTLDPSSTKKLTYCTVQTCAILSRTLPARIISNTESAREAHIKLGYSAEKMTVVPNGFDLTEFKPDANARISVRQELDIRQDCPLIGLVSRFDPIKDHHTFIKAAGILHDMDQNVHFVMCGNDITWGNPTLSYWIKNNGLEKYFHLLGQREDMPRITAALDISTMCSYGDAFPNAIGEAMSCGVPCVATDVGDLRQIVGDTGLIIPPKHPQALADAWHKLLILPQSKKDQLREAARQRVQEKYSLSVITDIYEKIYEEIIISNKKTNTGKSHVLK